MNLLERSSQQESALRCIRCIWEHFTFIRLYQSVLEKSAENIRRNKIGI